MSVFSDPESHAANPPETWHVVKAADRVWHLRTADGGTLDSFPTRKRAEEEREPGGFLRRLYDQETRWYAGETPAGHRSWAECRGERERMAARAAS